MLTDKAPKILGVNTRYYPKEFDPANPTEVKVVLVEGDIGDYAAYSGCGSNEFVARFGDKISFKEACCHFPGSLVEGKYRA